MKRLFPLLLVLTLMVTLAAGCAPSTTISGQVTFELRDSSGQAYTGNAKNALVYVYSNDARIIMEPDFYTETDSQGHYRIKVPAAGSYRVMALYNSATGLPDLETTDFNGMTLQGWANGALIIEYPYSSSYINYSLDMTVLEGEAAVVDFTLKSVATIREI